MKNVTEGGGLYGEGGVTKDRRSARHFLRETKSSSTHSRMSVSSNVLPIDQKCSLAFLNRLESFRMQCVGFARVRRLLACRAASPASIGYTCIFETTLTESARLRSMFKVRIYQVRCLAFCLSHYNSCMPLPVITSSHSPYSYFSIIVRVDQNGVRKVR